MSFLPLPIRVLIERIQYQYSMIKFNLTDFFGLWVWVYDREEKKYQKLKAYYKKHNIILDKDD